MTVHMLSPELAAKLGRDRFAKEIYITADLHPTMPHGVNHGSHVFERSGRTDNGVLDELADEAAEWAGIVLDLGADER